MKKAKENLKKLEVSEKPISLRASDYYELSIRQPYKLGDLSLEVESAQMKLLPYSPPEFYGGHENVVLVRIQNKTSEDLVEISSAKGKNVGFFEGYAIQLDRILFYSQEDSKVQIRIQKLTLGKRIEVLAKIPYKIDELEITFLGGITKRLMNGGEELDAAFMLKKGRSEKKFHETIGAKPAEVIFEGYKVKLITGFWDYLHVIVEKTNKTAPKIESSGAVFLPYEPPQKAAKAETEAYNSSVGYGQDMNIGRTYKIGDIKITAKEAILDIMPAREGFKDNCVEYLTLEVSKGLAKKELKLTKMGQHDELSSAIFRDYTITLYSLTESHVSVSSRRSRPGFRGSPACA